jgi:hypothetical protein
MQKRGRPKALIETEQVAVRLPKAWVDHFRPHVSKEIKEHLWRSLLDERRDPHLVKIAGQIEEIAKDVRRATGFEWHADRQAHQIFIEALRLLFADLPIPKAKLSKAPMDPKAVATALFNRYAETVRELERAKKTRMRAPLSHILEDDNDD